MTSTSIISSVDDILQRLQGVRKSGTGWLARCPAHDDQNPSLSIGTGDDGRILLHCFAGCPTENVVRALGLDMADLMPRTESRNGAPRHEPEAIYRYHDEDGKLLYEVLRMPGKQFRQRRPDGKGGWIWRLDGVRRVLYRLPPVLEAVKRGETVYIVEGEKDADRLSSLGLTATTSPGGAGKWQDEYTQALRGAYVVILPDNDEPGREHARKVAEALRGVARQVKVVQLPGLPEKGDVSDWLDAGHGPDELLEVVEWTPALYGRTPAILRAADVEREEVRWLWHLRIPRGKLTLIEGDPGLGKSWLTMVLAANISRGWPLPDDGPEPSRTEPGNVIILSAEDGAGDTIRPRLEDAGADLSRVFLLTGSQEEPDVGISMARDLDLLDEAARKLSPELVIVDPLQAYLGPGVDMHRANETRPVLAALARFAERHGCAVVLVRHLTKSGADRAIYRGLGSIDFTGAARSVLRVGKDPNDQQKRILAHIKTNLGPPAVSLAFVIHNGRFEWAGTSTVTAEDMDAPDDPEARSKVQEAIEFLREELADGPRLGEELIREARKQLDISDRTLKRAKAILGVESYRERGRGNRGQWYWSLPDSVKDVHANSVGTLSHKHETTSTSGFEVSVKGCHANENGTLGTLGTDEEAIVL